ncbi:MAG: family 43 glycosylhydrolase [Verrucomicrobia bacterium]|nr:family 43 glycosylhydrolase [Verrucomicrobiota bacterium]
MPGFVFWLGLMLAWFNPPAFAQSPASNRLGVPLPYQNPLVLRLPGGGLAEDCPDPSIIRSQDPNDPYWYLYGTTDPLNDSDRDANGNLIFHLITCFRSLDLVHWEYLGDVYAQPPAWAKPDALLRSPKPIYYQGRYYLYFVVTDANVGDGGSAIGVATSPTPYGPWTDSGGPVAGPEPGPGTQGAPRWTYDPEVLEADGKRYLYFGSYFGGISVRQLSADGLSTDPATERQITIPNRYEGSRLIKHEGYYYLLVSATNCCNGQLTGYSIFAGRSRSPLGPFVDREGNSLLDGLVGGTPVISMNGNRWVGPGHGDTFTDFAGQLWLVYHAVDQTDPYFVRVNPDGSVTVEITKRPALIDRLEWVDGWPSVRAGFWASQEPQLAPAAQPTQVRGALPLMPFPSWIDQPSQTLAFDAFQGSQLQPDWSWVRPPDASTYFVGGGAFHFNTQAGDLYVDTNNASVLTRALPPGDLVIETKVKINVPNDGKVYNYVQAGLLFYGNDDNYIKLDRVSIWETRQTEYAKEIKPVPPGYARYGNTVVGTPGEATWLRIVRRGWNGLELYTAYTSQDGTHWVRGGTWDHQLGTQAKLGLVAMAGTGFTAEFDYVRISRPLLNVPPGERFGAAP